MIRICFLPNGDYHTEARAQKMCHSLSANGYEIIVLVWDRTAQLPNIEYDDSIKIINIKVKCPHGSGIKGFFPIIKTFPRYLSYLEKLSPDIIHCQNFFLWPITLLFYHLFKIKVILDSLEPYSDEKAAYFFKGSKFIKNILWFLEMNMFKNANKRITVTEGMATRYIAGDSKDVSVILNIPDAQFNDVRTKRHNNIFTIGRVGGIDASYSGVDKLIAAISYLNTKKIQVKLTIGGPIYGDYEKVFNKLLSENSEFVRYIGIVPYKKLSSIIAGFDCIVAPNQETAMGTKYGYTVKMFEAMAVGIPIIITDILEVGEIINNYNCGILIKHPATADKIAEKIRQLVLNPRLCKELGENGRRAYETTFNWNIAENTLFQVYSQLLKH